MISIPFSGELDLERTLLGGQSFRWQAEGDGFRGVAFGRSVHVERRGQELFVDGDNDPARWAGYFALDADYAALLDGFRSDPVMKECVDFAPGIRVLRQDFFEADHRLKKVLP